MSINENPEQKRVMIFGSSPLPFENAEKNYAAGSRTWHFALSAKEANCKVMIISYRIPNSYKEKLSEIQFLDHDGIQYYSVEGHLFENKKFY